MILTTNHMVIFDKPLNLQDLALYNYHRDEILGKYYLKLSLNLPSSDGYYDYLGCAENQGIASLIGIPDGSSKKNSALCDYYYMGNSNTVFGSLRGGFAWDGSNAGLFCFYVIYAVSNVYVNVGFRSNLISLKNRGAGMRFLIR